MPRDQSVSAAQSILEDFRKVLDEADSHPSERYFILKSIVLKNLYGVDIMEEAVEICKLRLFLKLVAQLETYDQIEPLPDIDFNVRPGNTLVGFTSLEAVSQAMTIKPDGQHRAVFPDEKKNLDRINSAAKKASKAFDRFREQQSTLGGEVVTAADKQELRDRLRTLADELNHLLAQEYGIRPKEPAAYENWRASHQPFHWFVEFYGIMNRGGFDVVVGNPPYVEYSKVKTKYTIKSYQTESCGNLYAVMMERSLTILSNGRFGMIVPVSGACTGGFAPLRSILAAAGEVVVSHFNDRPSRLFDGIEHCRLSIFILNVDSSSTKIFSSKYNKWQATERETLFQRLKFIEPKRTDLRGTLPKFGHSFEPSILRKFLVKPSIQKALVTSSRFPIYYTRKLSNFVQILDFVPTIYDGKGKLRNPSELKELRLDSDVNKGGVLAFLNSTLFYWLVTVFSDCRNLNKREIEMTRLDFDDKDGLRRLAEVAQELMDDIKKNSQMLTINYRTMGRLTIQSTYPRLSKPIIDKIDTVLAKHYGFTDEELDFILNYDIKYRMGREK